MNEDPPTHRDTAEDAEAFVGFFAEGFTAGGFAHLRLGSQLISTDKHSEDRKVSPFMRGHEPGPRKRMSA